MENKWEFLGFESAGEGQPVQDWLDGLPEEHRDAIKGELAQLQILDRVYWDRPYFDTLDGEEPIQGFEEEEGISEIRFEKISDLQGEFHYRIYGCFFEEDEALRIPARHQQRQEERQTWEKDCQEATPANL